MKSRVLQRNKRSNRYLGRRADAFLLEVVDVFGPGVVVAAAGQAARPAAIPLYKSLRLAPD